MILTRPSPLPPRRRACHDRAATAARFLAAALILVPFSAVAGEWSGEIGIEARLFPNSPVDPPQHGDNLSLFGEAEYYHDWDDRSQRIVFTPFVRADQHDPERTHADVRELYWRRSFETWDLFAGLRKIFWGVTESRHLVDVINQTDLVDNLDNEDKLGQPMVSADFLRDWGTVSVFVMPWFRERTFPGTDGRLRSIPRVDADRVRYESDAGRHHVDFAIRWSHYIGDMDIGISHFAGTAREPKLLPGVSDDGEPVLVPFHDQVQRTSLDLQATKGSWLWKLELVSEDDSLGRHTAIVGGLEYTFYGAAGSVVDVGALAEYLGDDRDELAITPYENDVFLGTRLAFNDVQGSEILAGVISDLDGDGRLWNIEASRRIGTNWTVNLELRVVAGASGDPRLGSLDRDDHAQVVLSRHF